MKQLDWRHYRLVLALRNAGSLTGAANVLNLTQSAASHQMKEAERRLGIALVQRNGRSLQLTAAGAVIADAAMTSAPVFQDAENKAREVAHGAQNRLKIAFGLQDGLAWVPNVSQFLARSRDRIQVDLIYASRRPPSQCLRTGEADLAIEIGSANFPDSKRYHICDDELLCIIASNHPLKDKRYIESHDIVDQTYFAHSLVPQAGFELEQFFEPTGHRPDHIAHIESMEAILGLVEIGLGVSIQPKSTIQRALRSGRIVAKSLAPVPIVHSWYLHCLPNVSAEFGDELFRDLGDIIANQIAS